MGDSAVDGKDSCYASILPGMGYSRPPAAACRAGDRAHHAGLDRIALAGGKPASGPGRL